MSLAHLLRSADARLRLDLVRPPTPRLESAAAPPGRLPPPLAASAAAYGIRLEMARRDPSRRGVWRAERAPALLETLAPEMVGDAEQALSFVGSDAQRALQLARLDAVARTGYVDARIGQPDDPDDVAEVAAMLESMPWSDLGMRAAVPPLFPRVAEAMPDAEPDALVGGTLLSISASRTARIDEDDLRALVLRLIVARAEWGAQEASARIRSVGVLLARHGVLWRVPVEPIVAHEAFPTVEAWMLKRLEQARREAAPATDADERPARPAQMPKWVKKRFAKKAPQTHPEGKAGKKKEKKNPSRAQATPPPPPPVRAKRRGEPDAQESQPPRRRTPRPDWRRNSQWRRERGL